MEVEELGKIKEAEVEKINCIVTNPSCTFSGIGTNQGFYIMKNKEED
jgi:hypothetical protein